jgi:hypothetical protein
MAPAQTSIFGGAEMLICKALQLSNLRHRSALASFAQKIPSVEEIGHLLEDMFARIACNWEAALARTKLPASAENWRWHKPVPAHAEHNPSPEVTFERAVVQAALACGRMDWSNQVPIASGIGGSNANRRRAIDLIHRRSEGAFDFIELKIGSDTPLFAAFEIIQYGMIWLLSRQHQRMLGYANRALLCATDVRLCVVAPTDFYREHRFDDFGRGLSAGLAQINAPDGAKLTFQFQMLPDDFVWPGRYTPDQILRFIDARREWACAPR